MAQIIFGPSIFSSSEFDSLQNIERKYGVDMQTIITEATRQFIRKIR